MKYKRPRRISVTCEMLVLVASEAIASALSINTLYHVYVLGGFVWIQVLKTFPTIWCNILQMPFATGLWSIVGLSCTYANIIQLVCNSSTFYMDANTANNSSSCGYEKSKLLHILAYLRMLLAFACPPAHCTELS